ncbi:membrane hypothetical protein [Candidatus Xenohaliotis californiensis]|uniref:Uncharacterized protein n=1 Tax=Candidatus Xenohaliotis californiensis TaxID=84677 RepID=A0ABM9N703_9RICK|nr:membrane hypothetical protein [Candidatus Xenohaliotis californiensis]
MHKKSMKFRAYIFPASIMLGIALAMAESILMITPLSIFLLIPKITIIAFAGIGGSILINKTIGYIDQRYDAERQTTEKKQPNKHISSYVMTGIFSAAAATVVTFVFVSGLMNLMVTTTAAFGFFNVSCSAIEWVRDIGFVQKLFSANNPSKQQDEEKTTMQQSEKTQKKTTAAESTQGNETTTMTSNAQSVPLNGMSIEQTQAAAMTA